VIPTTSEQTVRCATCRAENPASQKFCGECGARLSVACPGCRHPNPAGQKFCGECGGPLSPPTAHASAPALALEGGPGSAQASPWRDAAPAAYTPKHLAEKILSTQSAFAGERKQVTVLFTDVSGFTSISERLDPEDVHAIMDRTFAVILEAVHACEGTVNQFLGDGVMALFGAPIAHEDHAHRALRAGLAIQERLGPLEREVAQTHGIQFRVRIGINTGLVVVGAIGKDLRMDYTAVGDTTNLASRLLNVAKPGQVVVSARTQHVTEGFFEFADLGEFVVKGKAQPVRAHAVRREIRGRTRLEVSRERGLTPLMGRDAELQALVDVYRAAAAGRGGVAVLTGEPGVGKSRLVYEFLRRLDESDALELAATCQSYSGSIAYFAIAQLVRRLVGVSEGMNDGQIRGLATRRLHDLGFEGDAPLALLMHFLGVAPPAPQVSRLSGPQLREQTFALLQSLLFRASAAQPLLLVVENLEWLDASSADFLRQLVVGLPAHRILALFTARPGLDAPWLDVPHRTTIALEGLDPAQVQHMVRTLLGVDAVSPSLVDLLLAKGEGNPLFVEEMLRQLRETRGIVIQDSTARLRDADVRIPETVYDIIAARIDLLADVLKHTLQVASVVGRQFIVPLLARVLEANGSLPGHLKELERLDFVFPVATEPEPIYTFKHALTQAVAYESLLERRRRSYHAAVGHGLEELYAGRVDEVVDLLAYHFEHSGELELAVDYAILAAEKAQKRWAHAEALKYFASALKRLDTMPDTEANRLRRVDAVVKQGEIMFALGRQAEHLVALDGIRDLVDVAADPPRRAAWYYWAGFLRSGTQGHTDVPISYCREAIAIADANGLEDIKPFAECCLTHVYDMAGRLREALAAGDRAVAAFDRRGNAMWACRTLWGLSMAAVGLGDWRRSLEYCLRALEHGEPVNDRRMKAVSLWRSGWTHVQRGDTTSALQYCEEALGLSPGPFDAAMARAAHGYALVKTGDLKPGVAELAEVVEWFERSHLPLTHARFALCLGEGYLRQDRPTEAMDIFQRVLTTSGELGYRYFEGMAHRLLGESLVHEAPTVAAAHLSAAERILEDIGARNEHAKTLVAQAQLPDTIEQSPGASVRLARAQAAFEELGTLG
jgi:class 3 adenylate cyclase/tetratricopeptide (TPR) repeat protein